MRTPELWTGPGLGLALLVGASVHACTGQTAPTYPQVREAICATAPTLPPSAERDRLLQACQVEASVLKCAEAYEAAAKALVTAPSAAVTAP